ncbi:MAG: DUF4157 domain-containing protein, partial [Paracoccaceae bacterium]
RNRSATAGAEPKLRLPGSLAGVPGQLQRSPTAGAAAAAQAVSTGGRGLSSAETGFFAPRFGQDLSVVRIHQGPQVDQAAAALGARAYTLGQDIALASGEYAPGTGAGRRLLAHELTHTLQQTGGDRSIRRQPVPDPGDLARRAKGWGERKWDSAQRWGDRQADRAERYGTKAADLAERGVKSASDLAERTGNSADGWWERGSGDITRIDFDGATVSVTGTTSASYKAVSGLMPHAPDAKGTNFTGAEHQDEPGKGPIPEGSYFLNPAEVESNPPGKFNTAAWGKYRTRLHETTGTSLWRHSTTARTGGFFLHQDANHNGTAGCIGIWNTTDNAAIHALIKANTAQIPVVVKYKAAPAAPVTKAPAPKVQRLPETGAEVTATAAEPHFLITAGITKIDADLARYKAGAFPSDYYDTLARHLFNVALRQNGRDYSAAFSTLDSLQWNSFGSGLQDHYTRIIGTDSANGWDKFRHFVFTAYLQWLSGGVLAPEAFTYGKELYDEAEQAFGKDPEGYSVPDVRADNKGEKFAEDMSNQQNAERLAAAKRAARRALKRLKALRRYRVGF